LVVGEAAEGVLALVVGEAAEGVLALVVGEAAEGVLALVVGEAAEGVLALVVGEAAEGVLAVLGRQSILTNAALRRLLTLHLCLCSSFLCSLHRPVVQYHSHLSISTTFPRCHHSPFQIT
jgi:hypothetical protein